MAEVGILGRDDRVELIDGEIIDMPPPGQLHSGTVDQLAWLLMRAVDARAIVRVQNPAVLGRYSAPQPDLALLEPRADFYKSGHPRPGDIFLMIEVADTSLRFDRDVKAKLYARHGVPELWLIDVRGKRLTRYRQPVDGAYARVDEVDVRIPVEPDQLPGVQVQLDALFTG
jgi:Uma2 family endonuclease